MRRTVVQGTAGYVTRMSGGVGGRGREASSYPDYAAGSARSVNDPGVAAILRP